MKLTRETVEAVVPDGRDRVIVDDDLPGFVLRVRASGAKMFAIQYRQRGRLHRLTVGKVEVLSATEARRKAKALLGRVADREDVAAALRAERGGPTMAEVFEDYCRVRRSARKGWHGRTEQQYRMNWKLHLAPRLANVRVEAVDHTDVDAIGRALGDRRGAAGAVLRLLRALLNFAEKPDKKLRPRGSNPVDSDHLYRSPRRVVNLSAAEYHRLEVALEAAESAGRVSAWVAAALRVIALTGARKMEIASAEWRWYDAREGVLRLPESKTGPRLIVLPEAARAILARLPRVVGNAYVFVGHKRGGRAGNLDRAFYAVRGAAGLPGVRIHDLRHAWASVAGDEGIAYPLIAAALGHTLHGITGDYVHVSPAALRAPVETVGGWIADALAGREPAKGTGSNAHTGGANEG